MCSINCSFTKGKLKGAHIHPLISESAKMEYLRLRNVIGPLKINLAILTILAMV